MTAGTTAEAVEIARGLTKAQRTAMQHGWGSIGVARALKSKGLSSGYLGTDPAAVAIVETDLGVAVQKMLLIHGGGHG